MISFTDSFPDGFNPCHSYLNIILFQPYAEHIGGFCWRTVPSSGTEKGALKFQHRSTTAQKENPLPSVMSEVMSLSEGKCLCISVSDVFGLTAWENDWFIPYQGHSDAVGSTTFKLPGMRPNNAIQSFTVILHFVLIKAVFTLITSSKPQNTAERKS